MKKPKLIEMLKFALYLGTIGYGGPAILAQMKKGMIDKKWIEEKDFMDALSLAQILPGATGVSIMAYFGYKFQKIGGAIISATAYIFPATIAIIILSYVYFHYGDIRFIQSIMMGLGAFVVGLLTNATFMMTKGVFKKLDFNDFKGILISLFAFIGIFVFHVNIIYLILLSGALGVGFFYFTHEFQDETFKSLESEKKDLQKIIKKFNFENILSIGILIVLIFSLYFFKDLWEIFTTFFKIGTFAFGGGFTTIPLIQHQVVDTLHWVTLKEFSDGIALGQITPGPVFITATFIGYKIQGILGAIIATIAIFMPATIAMLALSSVHAKVKELKIIKVIIKGFLAGFIGLLFAVTLQFAFKGLISWQTWFIFLCSLTIIMFLKKDILWAMAFTIIFSYFFI